MDLPIFFLEDYTRGDFLTLNEDISKHIVQVLRMKPSEKLQLTDGVGNLVTAQIIDAHKKKCTVKIIEKQFIQKKSAEISVAMALLKNAGRFEWFLEKATEIGVTEIIPLLTDRTEKQHFRFERMRQILISAMIQSKQVWLPRLHDPTQLSKVTETAFYKKKLIAHCQEEQKASLNDYRHLESVQILIGPEGDFTKEEIQSALKNNYLPVSLGETRLRTETAGIVAATILSL
jgi:16S rRNA (uracil1498-N3)-methyltransferase